MQIVLFSIFLLFVCIGLSGCTDFKLPFNDIGLSSESVKIVKYNVTTYWTIKESFLNSKEYSKPGFYHDIPESAYDVYYEISGTVKNVAGKMLDLILINAIFYDANGTELFRSKISPYDYDVAYARGDAIHDLPNGYSEKFNIKVYKDDPYGLSICKYFDKVESFKFIISTPEI